MRKNKYLLILSIMLAFGVTGCVSKDKLPEATQTEAVVSTEFTETESTKFKLYLKSYGLIDLTDYVTDSTGRDLEVSTKLLEDVFSFHVLSRPDSNSNTDAENTDVFLELQDDMNNLIQIQINGKTIIYNGNIFSTANVITGDAKEAKIKLNDFLFASGYKIINQNLGKDLLLLSAYLDEGEPQINVKYDNEGKIIESELGELMVSENTDETEPLPIDETMPDATSSGEEILSDHPTVENPQPDPTNHMINETVPETITDENSETEAVESMPASESQED